MPNTEVRVYRDSDGTSDFLDWLATRARNRPLRAKCLSRVMLLANLGSELRRPISDILRDGVYELRFEYQNVNYRILYGFIGRNIALLSHVTTKLSKVPNKDIELAVKRLNAAKKSPETHIVEFEIPDGQNQ